VTIEKLNGRAAYFPDARSLFEGAMQVEGEIPHHVVLLTNSGAVDMIVQGEMIENNHLFGRTEASLIFTDQALYFVSASDQFYTFPYTDIEYVGGDEIESSGTISISTGGSIYIFELARSGDPEAVIDAMGYLRSQIV